MAEAPDPGSAHAAGSPGEEHQHGSHGHGAHGSHRRGAHGHGGHRRRAGWWEAIVALLHPHSHDAADQVDSALESSADGMRALVVSLGALAATAAVQLVILLLSGSVALLADTIHNFADALTAVPLGLAFWLARRPATRRYTYGFGRAEDVAGVAIVVVVAASAVLVGWEAVDRLLRPSTVHDVAWVGVAGAIGFVGNEVVARYRIAVGRRIGSAALQADGFHARTDGLSSLGVVAGAVGVALGWRDADPVFGLLITATIVVALRGAARDIYRRLMDAVDPALVDRVEEVLGATPGVEGVDAVRVRWIGHTLHAEAEVVSAAGMSLRQAHDVAEEARHQLLHHVPRLTTVTVHTSPAVAGGDDPHATTAHHFEMAGPERSAGAAGPGDVAGSGHVAGPGDVAGPG